MPPVWATKGQPTPCLLGAAGDHHAADLPCRVRARVVAHILRVHLARNSTTRLPAHCASRRAADAILRRHTAFLPLTRTVKHHGALHARPTLARRGRPRTRPDSGQGCTSRQLNASHVTITGQVSGGRRHGTAKTWALFERGRRRWVQTRRLLASSWLTSSRWTLAGDGRDSAVSRAGRTHAVALLNCGAAGGRRAAFPSTWARILLTSGLARRGAINLAVSRHSLWHGNL